MKRLTIAGRCGSAEWQLGILRMKKRVALLLDWRIYDAFDREGWTVGLSDEAVSEIDWTLAYLHHLAGQAFSEGIDVNDVLNFDFDLIDFDYEIGLREAALRS